MAHQTAICEGDHVVFKTDDKTKVFRLLKKKTVYFEKSKIKPEDIIGQKYGTQFEIQKGKLVIVVPEKSSSATLQATAAGKDNRDLVASEENQKLTQEEIMKMKEEGVSGQDIIGKLVEQSETFKTKTAFSQEKYIKKKKKKHLVVFRVLRPNSSLLLDIYKQTPGKICNLRADTLSQLLCYSNVMSGATVAVVESCHGMVLGSVMERMGGTGRVLHMYPGNDMNRHVLQYFNFCEEQSKTLLEFPLSKLASLENGTLLATPTTSETVEEADSVKEASTADSGGSDDSSSGEGSGSKAVMGEDSDGKEATAATSGKKRKSKPKGCSSSSREQYEARRQQRSSRMKEAATILQEKNLDSLIIATKYDPVTLLLRLLPYVGPSRPVVVFSQHKEPLVECFAKVKETGCGVQMNLTESWYREYQVLPSRTHPLMSMSGTGGYLLSFIRIAK